MIELATAVVGYINAVDTVIDRHFCIGADRYPLQDHRNIELLLQASDIAPVEARLIYSIGDPFPIANVPLRYISFAAAINVGIYR
jgi:hypothetical protein